MKKSPVEVKAELCRKYRRLATITKSAPRRKNLLNKSLGYAQQVVKLGGSVGG
jgi:hypothetical protein